ncbi:hypothetical protein PG985_016127 [Apiospora marii]|uniref:uncharacterized protein n=1 Tax=Apiospora marii TaxID=335849 RepID=UPI003130EEC1
MAPAFRKWESFRKSLEAVWSKREIEEMAAALRDPRDEMEFRILVSFRYSDASLQLEQSTQRIVDTFMNSRDSFAGQLKVQSERIIQIQELLTRNHAGSVRSEEDISSIQRDDFGAFESPLVGADQQCRSLEERSESKLAMEKELSILMTENEILGSLSFPSMMTRMESIEAAHTQTFRWVHQEPGSTEQSWNNLVTWLRHGNGIYWVNGKLAARKSTLMKYLCDHSKTRDALKLWSKGHPVEVSSFFFWSSGDENQRSQSGMLRSFLFQLFQRHRHLLEQVLPDIWNTYHTRARAMISKRDVPPDSPLLPPKPSDLTVSQLKKAFRDLIVFLQRKVNICFFIDGLDEYAGDYQNIAEFLQQHIDLTGVKFCISSRPLLIFEQVFRDLPGLRLQDLTKRDIKEYINSHLYSHSYMKQLEKRHPGEASRLVSEIVHKARGVFLWVKLVTRSILRGLSDYNRISDLQKRISYLPSDLEALYNHILDGVDPFYRVHMSRVLQIFRVAQTGSSGLVTLLNMSWADEEETLLVETTSIKPYTEEDIGERCEIMDARLKSVCAGLLETNTDHRSSGFWPDCHVLYMHRTVSDWLAKPEVWGRLMSVTVGTGFSPNLAMLKSRIMMLKTWNPEYHGRLDMRIVVDALNYAREAEADLQCGFPKLLDKLDAVTEFHWRNTSGFASHLRPGSPLPLLPKSLVSNFSEEEGLEGGGLQELGLHLPHWSQSIKLDGGRTLGQHATFFDLARAFGLKHYVDAKYDAGHAFVEHEVSHWLLMQAFSGTCGSASTSNRPKDPDPKQVERILASGIDPNMSFDGGMTPWQGALLDAFWHASRRPSPSSDDIADTEVNPSYDVWERKAQAWAQVLEAFIQHGADPHCPGGAAGGMHHFRDSKERGTEDREVIG